MIVTVEPGGAWEPEPGAIPTTSPSGTSASYASTTSTANPAAASSALASSALIPETSGTATVPVPSETTMETVEPCSISPLALALTTRPSATDGSLARCTSATRPAAVRAATASASGRPTTAGTSTSGGVFGSPTSARGGKSSCSRPVIACVMYAVQMSSGTEPPVICSYPPNAVIDSCWPSGPTW